jgi:hypothetical protein
MTDVTTRRSPVLPWSGLLAVERPPTIGVARGVDIVGGPTRVTYLRLLLRARRWKLAAATIFYMLQSWCPSSHLRRIWPSSMLRRSKLDSSPSPSLPAPSLWLHAPSRLTRRESSGGNKVGSLCTRHISSALMKVEKIVKPLGLIPRPKRTRRRYQPILCPPLDPNKSKQTHLMFKISLAPKMP